MCPLFLTSWLAGWALLVPPSLSCLEDLLSLFSTLSKAHLGYLHLVRAFLRWSFSCWSNSGLLHTLEALWERVWITLKFGWEVMVTVPTVNTGQYVWVSCTQLWTEYHQLSGLKIVSKKGMDPSSLLSSTVNLIAGSTLLMCCRKPCLLVSLWMTKVSSTYLCQNLGVGGSA